MSENLARNLISPIATRLKPLSRIILSASTMDELRTEAIDSYPEECCGLLLSNSIGQNIDDTRKITRVQRMKNAYEIGERYHRFSIDPKEFLKVEEDAIKKDEEIVGVYHSHPNATSEPSMFDLIHGWPDLSYIIVEVRDRTVLSTTCWTLKEDKSVFIPKLMEIEEEK